MPSGSLEISHDALRILFRPARCKLLVCGGVLSVSVLGSVLASSVFDVSTLFLIHPVDVFTERQMIDGYVRCIRDGSDRLSRPDLT